MKYKQSCLPSHQPKTSWWAFKEENLNLVSCTPTFCEFVQYPMHQIVQSMSISQIFPPCSIDLVKTIAHRALVSNRVEIIEVDVLKSTSEKQKMSCWWSSLNSGSSSAPETDKRNAIIELTFFELGTNLSQDSTDEVDTTLESTEVKDTVSHKSTESQKQNFSPVSSPSAHSREMNALKELSEIVDKELSAVCLGSEQKEVGPQGTRPVTPTTGDYLLAELSLHAGLCLKMSVSSLLNSLD